MEEALFQNYTRLVDATDGAHYRYLYNYNTSKPLLPTAEKHFM